MLPTYPQSDDPKPPRHAPVLLTFYWIGGAIGGALATAMAAVLDYAHVCGWFANQPRRSFHAELLYDAVIGGMLAGIFCGNLLWFVVSFWNAARHPVRAASLCGSLAGSVFLIAVSMSLDSAFRSDVGHGFFRLLMALAMGVIFGLVTSVLAQLMENGLKLLMR